MKLIKTEKGRKEDIIAGLDSIKYLLKTKELTELQLEVVKDLVYKALGKTCPVRKKKIDWQNISPIAPF